MGEYPGIERFGDGTPELNQDFAASRLHLDRHTVSKHGKNHKHNKRRREKERLKNSGNDKTPTPPSGPPAPQLSDRPERKGWSATKILNLFLAILGVMIGLVALIAQIWGLPWATPPKVVVHDSPLKALPFVVKNESWLFTERDVHLICYIELAEFQDQMGRTGVDADFAFAAPKAYDIGPGEQVNYPCDVSEHLSITPNGALAFGNLSTGPGVFTPPLMVTKMCVVVFGTYRGGALNSAGRFESHPFQWYADTRMWIEGRMAAEPEPAGNIRPDVQQCSGRVRGKLYPLFTGHGPGIMQLDKD